MPSARGHQVLPVLLSLVEGMMPEAGRGPAELFQAAMRPSCGKPQGLCSLTAWWPQDPASLSRGQGSWRQARCSVEGQRGSVPARHSWLGPQVPEADWSALEQEEEGPAPSLLGEPHPRGLNGDRATAWCRLVWGCSPGSYTGWSRGNTQQSQPRELSFGRKPRGRGCRVI